MAEILDIFSLVKSGSANFGSRVALENEHGFSMTYQQLYFEIEGLRQHFHNIGITRQSRIAIVLPNGENLAVALLAVTSCAIAVPLNPEYRKPEYTRYFDDINITHVVLEAGAVSPIREVAAERNVPVLELRADRSFDLGAAGKQGGRPVVNELPGPNPGDIALILLTSGSTGRPKKVPLSHRNICVSVQDICRTLRLTAADKCLCMWEQFHIGGLVDLLLVPLASGGTVICTSGFNADGFFRLLRTHFPTWFQGVPTTLYQLLLRAKSNTENPRGSLRFIRSVASALNQSLMQELEDVFGVPVVQTFGMTEAAPLISTNPLPPDVRKPGSVGKSCGPEIRIENPDGQALAMGEIGEVVVKGPNVFSGYEDAPEANAKSLRDGWFRTGDTGYLDADGYLFLRGRLKEMINRGGEKITPQEVDDVLLKHPAIAQAATFSVRHRTLGEAVGAAIVVKPGQHITESEVRDHAARHLASFKIPQKIMLIDKMPVDPVGKINRLVLAILSDSHSLTDIEAERLNTPGLQAVSQFQGHGKGTPVFWFCDDPALEGAMLARHLPQSYSLFSLNSGKVRFKNDAETVEKIAGFYAQQIVDAVTVADIAIGGSGFGARIAVRVSQILADHSRPVSRLCLVDHFEDALRDFSGKILLLFGKATADMPFTKVHIGDPAWLGKFAHQPRIYFFKGRGEDVFKPARIESITPVIDHFLSQDSETVPAVSNHPSALLKLVYRFGPAFALYRLLN